MNEGMAQRRAYFKLADGCVKLESSLRACIWGHNEDMDCAGHPSVSASHGLKVGCVLRRNRLALAAVRAF